MGLRSTSAPAKWLAEMLNEETGGNDDKAIEYYEKALTSSLKIFESEHPYILTIRENLKIAKQASPNK